MCVSSLGFAWGVLRGVLGEYAVLKLSKLMHLQYTMYSIFDWEVRGLGMRLDIFTKIAIFCGEKMFQRQI